MRQAGRQAGREGERQVGTGNQSLCKGDKSVTVLFILAQFVSVGQHRSLLVLSKFLALIHPVAEVKGCPINSQATVQCWRFSPLQPLTQYLVLDQLDRNDSLGHFSR